MSGLVFASRFHSLHPHQMAILYYYYNSGKIPFHPHLKPMSVLLKGHMTRWQNNIIIRETSVISRLLQLREIGFYGNKTEYG